MVLAGVIVTIFGSLAIVASIVVEARARESVVAISLFKSLPLLICLAAVGHTLLEKVLKVESLLSQIGGSLLLLGSVGILTAAALEAGGMRQNPWVVFATRVFPWLFCLGVLFFTLGLPTK